MGRPYMPYQDAKFDEWFRNFKDNVDPIATALGIDPVFVAAVTVAWTDWTLTYTAKQAAHNVAEAATGTNDVSRVNAHDAIRPLVKMMQGNPNMTVAQRQTLQVTVPDTNPTPTSPDYVVNLAPPLLLLEVQDEQVVIHFGVNPSNEKRNAKPAEIAGAKIWYRIGTGAWTFVADDTNSPYTHNLVVTVPTGLEYRAQWFDKKMRTGSFSETAKCAVSP